MKVADLFAGIGGIRLGFQLAAEEMNLEIKNVFTSEINKFSLETYNANFNENNIPLDITAVDEKQVPDFDILMAGFPCQPFSQAGLGKGFNDARGTLYFDIERIVLEKKPRAILLENVKRLKTHDNGNTLKVIKKSLENAGYRIFYDILKARDFGVPQNRERIYIVGFLDNSINFEFPKKKNVEIKVGNILQKKVDSKYTISDNLWTGHRKRKEKNKKNGKGFGYGLFNKNSDYTNTISARYYKDGSEILIEQKGKNPRKLTPREAARLQGFPETFKIPVSDTQAYRQFGNSVTVPVIKEIAKNILEQLK